MKEKETPDAAPAKVMLTARIEKDLVERLDRLTGTYATRSDLIASALYEYVKVRERLEKARK